MSTAIELVQGALKAKSEALLRHSVKTSHVAAAISDAICDDFKFVVSREDIKTAGLLHDIGKLNLSNSMLEKKGPLSSEEWLRMRVHPLVGDTLVRTMNSYKHLGVYVRQHHEKADGSGYPGGLTLHQIDPVSRVINIADQFSAITEARAYKAAIKSPDIVLALLQGDIDAFFGSSAEKVFDVIYYGFDEFEEQTDSGLMLGSWDANPESHGMHGNVI